MASPFRDDSGESASGRLDLRSNASIVEALLYSNRRFLGAYLLAVAPLLVIHCVRQYGRVQGTVAA